MKVTEVTQVTEVTIAMRKHPNLESGLSQNVGQTKSLMDKGKEGE